MKEAVVVTQSAAERTFQAERREHEYHQDTVRIALMRMEPAMILEHMLPSNEALTQLLADKTSLQGEKLEHYILHEASSPLPEVTTMIWEVKAAGQNVVNPNQVILVGGGGRQVDPTHPIKAKDIIKAARNEAFEEVHLVAHRPKILDNITYTYSFDHPRLPDTKKPGRLKNTTHLVVARAAPHDRVHFFDPQDKLQNVLQLTPSRVSSLFETETIYHHGDGRVFTLVDSLSSSAQRRKKAHVISDPTEIARFKAAVEAEAYIYEAQTMRRVLSYLESVPDHQLRKSEQRQITILLRRPDPASQQDAIRQLTTMKRILHNIEKSYSDKTNFPNLYVDQKLFGRLKALGVSEHRLKSRMKLIQDLSTATRWVAQDLSVEYYAETGPQFPLLLAHMLSELQHWSKHDYELIARCPPLKHIVDTVCETFNVNTAQEGWYATVVKNLCQFLTMEKTNPPAYEGIKQRLTQRYCNPDPETGVHVIGDPIKLGKLSQKVEGFLLQQFEPLKKTVNPAILTNLRPNALGSTTQEIPELVMRMFGMSQYTGQPINNSERNAAMRKLCEMIRIDQVDQMVTAKTGTHIKPLRSAMDTLLGDRVGTIRTAAGTFDHHIIPPEKIHMFKHLIDIPPITIFGIDLSEFDIPLAFSVRVKDEYSAYRKDLERGGIESPDEDMSDIFGFMIGLDLHRFEQQLYQRHPLIAQAMAQEITRHWQRWASQLILNALMIQVTADRETQHPVFRLYKGRVSSTMEGLLDIEGQQKGSASSKEKWEWIKYVMEMHENSGAMFQVEMQHFPSLEDMVKKKLDDERFHRDRLFNHTEGRYPLIRVVFGMQETYGDAMQAYYAWRNERKLFRLPWHRRLRLWLFFWLKRYAQQDAAMYEDSV